MCLSIDIKEHHLSIQGGYEPKTTILPKKVYKILHIDLTHKNTYYTPYTGTIIHFAHEKAVLKEPTMMYYYRNSWEKTTVDIGIHAFHNKDAALIRSTLLHNGTYAVFEAIIPPRTKYFIGVYGDIVSERLIIKNKIIQC